MNTSLRALSITFLLLIQLTAWAATLYVDLNSVNPVPPYSGWATAATNIQDAIDAATDGDLVLVTNGVYAAGGKVMFGDLTNRVALDKAITVQSVNGPWVTTIKGNGATNGFAAVRCAWITNGATLQGFTLTAGATRSGGDQDNAMSGGGALLHTNALLRNCLVISNLAQTLGGGVFRGTVINTAIIGNRANGSGSGAANAALLNCTVASNWLTTATIQCRHTNSIVYNNSPANHVGGTFTYSCTTPLPAGIGNISTSPQLFADSIHLQSSSPCRGTGANLAVGTDIDGQLWETLPSMGCDEWGSTPIIVAQPKLQLTNNPICFTIAVVTAGFEPLDYRWFRNGVLLSNDGHFSFTGSSNLMANGVNEADAGNYHVVVSNSFGVVTSAVAQLVFRYVNGSNATPAAPFTTWVTAATNIQDAIDAAIAGEVVLVADGIYRSGGKVMGVNLTNRVAINKALIVQSVNGATQTIIEGNWNPTVTNGPAAVRCAWLTNGAALNGFTLRGGATRLASPSSNQDMFGGGAWGSSTNALIYNSAILTNTAGHQGGGAYRVALVNCMVVGNRAIGSGTPGMGTAGAGQGGGAAISHLRNCIVRGNYADQSSGGGVSESDLINSALVENSSYQHGGGVYGGRMINCTVTRNTSSGYGGYGAAVNGGTLTNCIVWENFSRGNYATNHSGSTLAYCVSLPLAAGVGNLALDPQILGDGVHVTETSPARAAGITLATGADIDGEVWNNPPSIGSDEWTPAPRIAVSPTNTFTYVSRRMTWGLPIAGQPPFSIQWFKDGQPISDDDHYSQTSTVGMVVNKFGPEHSGQYFVVASNSFGVATSKVASVVIHCVDATAMNPTPPYSSWATAANTIQDAVDVAQTGAIVLVTNGLYATGGRLDSYGLTNRVIIDKPITVMSLNGYKSTIIEGRWDVATNGPSAVRCVTLINASVLAGFTIQNGATLVASLVSPASVGGGIYSAGFIPVAAVQNCLLTNNAAYTYGGGAYAAKLKNCLILGNYAGSGGRAAACGELINCTVAFNSSSTFSGGSGGVTGNVGPSPTLVRLRNSIIWENYRSIAMIDNYTQTGTEFTFSASASTTFTAPAGISNRLADMSFVDTDFHISTASQYRGAGSSLYASGEDIDGEPWANPPSMGADEVVEANIAGPLSISIFARETNTFPNSTLHRLFFSDSITGRVSRIDWDYGDGVIVTNQGYWGIHYWTNPGTYTVTSTAYNVDNPNGVSASVVIQVLPLTSPSLQSGLVNGSGYNFAFMAQTNANYTIQYTTNLAAPISWQTLKNIYFSPGGTTLVTDPAWTNAARFYRVLAW
jgi:hypothetical protein